MTLTIELNPEQSKLLGILANNLSIPQREVLNNLLKEYDNNTITDTCIEKILDKNLALSENLSELHKKESSIYNESESLTRLLMSMSVESSKQLRDISEKIHQNLSCI